MEIFRKLFFPEPIFWFLRKLLFLKTFKDLTGIFKKMFSGNQVVLGPNVIAKHFFFEFLENKFFKWQIVDFRVPNMDLKKIFTNTKVN